MLGEDHVRLVFREPVPACHALQSGRTGRSPPEPRQEYDITQQTPQIIPDIALEMCEKAGVVVVRVELGRAVVEEFGGGFTGSSLGSIW